MKLALICAEKLPAPAVRGGAIQIMIDGISPFLSFGHELTVFSITDPLFPARKNAIISHRFSQVANHLERIYPKACHPAGNPVRMDL